MTKRSTEFRYWIGEDGPYERLKRLAGEVDPRRVVISLCTTNPMGEAARLETMAELLKRDLLQIVQLCQSRGWGPEIGWSGQDRIAEVKVHCRCRAHYVKRPP